MRAEDPTVAPPVSPVQMFNAGTRQFQAGKLAEAEALLQTALISQDMAVQPLALYNLGCVRAAQGAEILKKNNNPGATASHADDLTSQAEGAGREIDDAIASENMDRMVMAYLRGGGVHHEINDATKAVTNALESQRAVLTKWQRAADDFRSAVEMETNYADAAFNADTTERAIAALIDKMKKLQQAGMKMKAAGQQLGDKLKALKGMIPAPNMPPGAPGDEDNDEEMPGLKQGDKEGASKPGQEMKMSAQEAEQLLNGYKLSGEHRLPLGQEGTTTPKNSSGKPW